jgi:hypothetical protein
MGRVGSGRPISDQIRDGLKNLDPYLSHLFSDHFGLDRVDSLGRVEFLHPYYSSFFFENMASSAIMN